MSYILDFLGGASGQYLKQEDEKRQSSLQEEREVSTFQRKQDILAQIRGREVANTRVVEENGQWFEVRENNEGQEIGRRQLSESEARERQRSERVAGLEERKVAADVEGSELGLSLDRTFGADERTAGLERTRAQTEQARAGAAASAAQTRLAAMAREQSDPVIQQAVDDIATATRHIRDIPDAEERRAAQETLEGVMAEIEEITNNENMSSGAKRIRIRQIASRLGPMSPAQQPRGDNVNAFLQGLAALAGQGGGQQ